MSHRKRLVKRIGVGLAILFSLLLILNAAYSWHTGRQLRQRLDKLQAAGEPISFAELAPEPLPPEQDAAVQLERLVPQLESFSTEYNEFLTNTPMGESFSERQQRGESPTPEEVDAIRAILSNYPELPQAIEDAALCEGYTSQLDYDVPDSAVLTELISGAGDRRMFVRLLSWRIIVLLADNKPEEALEAGIAMLRLSRHLDREPALINGLVALAVRSSAVDSLNTVLRAGHISPDMRAGLHLELALHEDPARIRHVMTTERAINLTVSRDLFSRTWLLPWLESITEIAMLDYHESLFPAIQRPWHESHAAVARSRAEAENTTSISGIAVLLLGPAIDSAYVAWNRNTVELRCLRILNALTAFAQDNGREAEGLDDLGLSDAETLDPFSGKPLKLKRSDGGWVVYSVASNGEDDGGRFEDNADYGLAPAGYAP